MCGCCIGTTVGALTLFPNWSCGRKISPGQRRTSSCVWFVDTHTRTRTHSLSVSLLHAWSSCYCVSGGVSCGVACSAVQPTGERVRCGMFPCLVRGRLRSKSVSIMSKKPAKYYNSNIVPCCGRLGRAVPCSRSLKEHHDCVL